jgi:hypothetical protein
VNSRKLILKFFRKKNLSIPLFYKSKSYYTDYILMYPLRKKERPANKNGSNLEKFLFATSNGPTRGSISSYERGDIKRGPPQDGTPGRVNEK